MMRTDKLNPTIDEDSIARLVRDFYAKARRDALIGPVFEVTVEDWDLHLARLEAFWSSVMLTSGRYKGDPFAAHLPLGLSEAMFTRWLALWRETAAEIFEPAVAAEFELKAERIARSLSVGLGCPLAPHPKTRPPILLEMTTHET